MGSARNTLLSGICLVPWLAGCAASTWTSAAARTPTLGTRVVYVTPFTNQGTVELVIGDELRIELPTQNGGRWQLLRTVAPVLLGQPTTRRAGVVEPPVGHGDVYTFRANSVGVELVSFAPLPGRLYNSAGFPYTLRVEVAAADRPAVRP